MKTGGVYFEGLKTNPSFGVVKNDQGQLNSTKKLSVFVWAMKKYDVLNGTIADMNRSYLNLGMFTLMAGWGGAGCFVGLTFANGVKRGFGIANWYALEPTMLGFTFNSETGVIRSYKNGELTYEYSGYNIELKPSPANLLFDCRNYPPYYWDPTQGLWLFRFMMWSDELSPDDVAKLYANPDNPPKCDKLICWLTFDENQGVIARDRSGNNNHCGLFGGFRWVTPIRNGMMFRETGGVVFKNYEFPSTPTLVTVFELHKQSTTNVYDNQFAMSVTNATTGRYITSCGHVKYWDTNRFWALDVPVYFGWARTTMRYSKCLGDGKVFTVAGVCDSAGNRTCYVFSNGELLGQEIRALGTFTPQTVNIMLGAGKTRGIVYAAFMYDRPLSLEEIKQISLYWHDETKIPKDGLIFGCILDRLKYGDTPYDFVSGVYAEYLGTPRWVVKKPLRTVMV